MKKTAIILAMLMIFSCSAFGQENGLSVNVSCETYADSVTGELKQTLTVYGEASDLLAEKNIGLLVIRPDVTPAEDMDPMEFLAAAYQGETDKDGKYNFSFDFNDESGLYTFTVFADTLENSASAVYSVPSVSKIRDFLVAVDNGSISASAMAAQITASYEELTIDATVFNQLSDTAKENICSEILNTPGTIDINNFFDIYVDKVITTGIKNSDGNKIKIIADYYENILNLSNLDIYSDFLTISNKNMVYDMMVGKNASTIEEIRTIFYHSAFLTLAKEALSYQNILPLLQKYRASLGNPSYISTVAGKTPENQTLILNSVGAELVNIDTLEKLEESFIRAINANNAYIPPAPSAGGGGGGGGGGSKHTVAEENIGSVVPAPIETIIFSDLGDASWAKDAILALNEMGIVKGDGKGNFLPNNNITRAEFVKILVEAFKIDSSLGTNEKSFGDVKESDWYYSYVNAAVKRGIVNGKTDTYFGAKDNISRQDMATLIYRVLTTLNKIEPVETVTKKYSDFSSISEYAKNSILMLSEYGIINGFSDGSFKPMGNATRAEATQLMYNVLNFAK